MKNEADIFFEVSFECGRKVGGIYTVIKSKASEMIKYYGENYYCIGSYDPEQAHSKVLEEEPPSELKRIFEEMEGEGIICKYGRWISAEGCKIILIDASVFRERKVQYIDSGMTRVDRNINAIKFELWNAYGIDSYRMGFDYDDPVSWAYSAGILIQKIKEKLFASKKVVAQFHEWLSGAAILYLRQNNVLVGTVFTTHATRLGRSKSSSGEDLSTQISEGLDSGKKADLKEAYEFFIEAQHLMEVACAKNSDVFTTVSEVLADEAEFILGKKPDIITFDALDNAQFPSMRVLGDLHLKNLEKINLFLQAYFSSYYETDLENNIVIFTSGRYEYYNKGIDIFIDGLAELNKRMKSAGDVPEVFAFIMIPSAIKGPNPSILDNIVILDKIKEDIHESLELVEDKVVDDVTEGRFDLSKMTGGEILGNKALMNLKALGRKFRYEKRGKLPPLSAFELKDEKNDMIINKLKSVGLINKPDDKVRVVFYPIYLNPDDSLLGISYYDMISGSTVGIFPSRYEPWGYTPQEAAAMMTLSVTTDQGGFGVFINSKIENESKLRGVKVLGLKNASYKQSVAELADYLFHIIKLTHDERVELKIDARQLSELSDWKNQSINYVKAHNLALKRMKNEED